MVKFLDVINTFIWGAPLLILILLVGLSYTVGTGFLQLRKLPSALIQLYQSFRKNSADTKEVSPYRALCTALGATVGTGNLAGVAGAIAIGGPGAVFWMWISGILGMITKFAEVVLAVRYREKNVNAQWIGGPMYIIQNGLPKRFHFLAGIYCFFGVVAAFGVGNATQVNAVVSGIEKVALGFGIPFGGIGNLLLGLLLGIFVFVVFRGGAGSIGRITEKLVPVAAGVYFILAIGVLIAYRGNILAAVSSIIIGAFNPKAVTGGIIGSIIVTLRIGTSRGVFTNEAGMGTASIAHAEACVSDPMQQGLLGITEVFLDTIVLCTLTALVILCTGVPIPYGSDPGITLTMDAFSSVYGQWITVIITLIVCLLALATIMGWGLYGARCAQFLFGEGVWNRFVILQVAAVVVGAMLNTSTVWVVSELVNGLMAIPNLIALTYLMPTVFRIVKAYRR